MWDASAPPLVDPGNAARPTALVLLAHKGDVTDSAWTLRTWPLRSGADGCPLIWNQTTGFASCSNRPARCVTNPPLATPGRFAFPGIGQRAQRGRRGLCAGQQAGVTL